MISLASLVLSPGYGRNYLIPQGVGVVATWGNRKKVETLLQMREAKEAARLEDYRALAQQMEGKTLRLVLKLWCFRQNFGSVTNVQVAQALKSNWVLTLNARRL